MPAPSLTGSRYFLLFIDDHTRFMFVYTIKARSKLYDCYEDFCKKARGVFRADVHTIEHATRRFETESAPSRWITLQSMRNSDAFFSRSTGHTHSSPMRTRHNKTGSQNGVTGPSWSVFVLSCLMVICQAHYGLSVSDMWPTSSTLHQVCPRVVAPPMSS
jgi:hypothetical protein